MRKLKDLKSCISVLQGLQGRSSVDPEKKHAVAYVIREVNKIRRKPDLRQRELHESIRSIVETLIRAFTKHD